MINDGGKADVDKWDSYFSHLFAEGQYHDHFRLRWVLYIAKLPSPEESEDFEIVFTAIVDVEMWYR